MGGDDEEVLALQSGKMVGALISRGCRCVLIRSTEEPKEWEGMRIPTVAAKDGETPKETALRAAIERCELEDDQVSVLEGVAPVMIYEIFNDKLWPVPVYALYATEAPPGPLEAADVEDPKDVYDWYTFPRAMHALGNDQYSKAALAGLAVNLAAGCAAGAVPNKWGGVFGQDWAVDVLQHIHGAFRLESSAAEGLSFGPGSGDL